MTYLLYVDGDRVGARIEGAMAAGDLATAAQLSDRVGRAILKVVRLIEDRGGKVVFAGGDNVLAEAPATDDLIGEVLGCYARHTGMTASVGVGTTSYEAYLALKTAKSQGGGQVCWWDRLKASPPRIRTTQASNSRPGDDTKP